MPAAQWPLTTTRDVRLVNSGGPHQRALGGQGIGWGLHHGRTLAPSPLVPGYKKLKAPQDIEPTVVAVTPVRTKKSKNDSPSPKRDSAPVVINMDSDSDDTVEWQT